MAVLLKGQPVVHRIRIDRQNRKIAESRFPSSAPIASFKAPAYQFQPEMSIILPPPAAHPSTPSAAPPHGLLAITVIRISGWSSRKVPYNVARGGSIKRESTMERPTIVHF